jgi:hypothetical protein
MDSIWQAGFLIAYGAYIIYKAFVVSRKRRDMRREEVERERSDSIDI